jgi:hypothetical protein
MKSTGRWLVHRLIPLAAVGVFIAAHGAILYYLSSHAAVSIAAIAVILMVIMRRGLLGPYSRGSGGGARLVSSKLFHAGN